MESTVWIFLDFFFSPSSKFFLRKSDLVKIPLFFGKILLRENSHTAVLVTSETISHVHAGSQYVFSPSFEKQQPLCCPWQPGLTWASEQVSCKKVVMLKEGLQLGCPFLLLLLQWQRESKGYCKLLLPQDMQVLRELMQLKNLNRHRVIWGWGGAGLVGRRTSCEALLHNQGYLDRAAVV